jgi:hypothetical protein
MKLIVVYRSNSEHARKTEEFLYEFRRRYPGQKVEVLDTEQREGDATAALYDITRYPGILALRDDGTMNMVWQGEDLPLIDEVAGYLH